jgi:hypothetical protein
MEGAAGGHSIGGVLFPDFVSRYLFDNVPRLFAYAANKCKEYDEICLFVDNLVFFSLVALLGGRLQPTGLLAAGLLNVSEYAGAGY